MLTIKTLRVGSRLELLTAEELYIRIGHEQHLFVLTDDDRLLAVGKSTDWRNAVEVRLGYRPIVADEKTLEKSQREYDIGVLREAFASEYLPDRS